MKILDKGIPINYLDKKGTAQRVKILFDRQRNLYFCFFFVKLLFSKNY
jgi:hypothetical protein